ncbi:28S ribosomal protein S5, mitochondrial [Savitreella phatthalungensis]
MMLRRSWAVLRAAHARSVSNLVTDLTRDVIGPTYRRTALRIDYPADFSKLDPTLDYAPIALQNDEKLPMIPPDTTGQGTGEDETTLLAKATGLEAREIRSLIQRPLVLRRVVNQTRKGKQASYYSLAIVGNGNGMIGLGEGKHVEAGVAQRKAIAQAVKNMLFVPRYQGRTIYGEVDHKFHAVKLKIRSRPPGFGVRANHYINEICRCAGITDLSAKVWGSRTGMNVIKATFEALSQAQVMPDELARDRGRRMIDVTERFYS